MSLIRTVIGVFALALVNGYAVEQPAVINTTSPAIVWAETERLIPKMFAPQGWHNRKPTDEEVAAARTKIRSNAIVCADKLNEFIQRFPTNENVTEARAMYVFALSHAVAAGDTASEQRAEKYVAATLADKNIPENDRVAVLFYAGNLKVMKREGMNFFIQGRQKFNQEMDRGARLQCLDAIKMFPTNELLFGMLMSLAERAPLDEQKKIAQAIVDSKGAPENPRSLAQHLLNGTKPYEVGKPLDIRFTALDGREVDLAKMKGKVVLIDFWSTSCGPCLVEMPKVKSVYEKFHDRGFEIIGISLDDKQSVLQKYLKTKNLPWPQHFDGKGWQNKFAGRYGIHSIPTMWLVDKKGNLRNANVGGWLEESVPMLLAEKE